MSVAVIPRSTADDLEAVAKFFGIDLEWNKHIFRAAAQADAPGFERVIVAMAQAVRQDARFGTGDRIRVRAAAERAAIDKQKKSKGLPCA